MESNGTSNAVDSPAIWTWVLKSRNSEARFYLAENNNTQTRSVTNFSMTLKTSSGAVRVPELQLRGRQSRWVVTDYMIGNETLLYSSAEMLTYGLFDHPVVVLYMKEGHIGDFAFKSSGNITFRKYGAQNDIRNAAMNITGSSRFIYAQGKGQSVVKFSNGVLAYLLDVPTAYSFFAPSTTSNPLVASDQQIFVIGPYLVRSAQKIGDRVHVIGDNAKFTTMEVYAGPEVNVISWNGKNLPTRRTQYGSLLAHVSGVQDRKISLPDLSHFKSANSCPEIIPTYDDSNWVIAAKASTQSQVKPLTLPVLFSSDYKFYTGAKIYRGYFSGNTASSLNITVQGGAASGWNAWLNGNFLGYHPGNASLWSTTALLKFGNITLNTERNVLTIVTDYTGHDQTSTGPTGAANPRGIIGAQLLSTNGTRLTSNEWKIQGNAGGEENIDPVRGPWNEGGLYGERLGWHLPGFDTRNWTSSSPIDDGVQGAGIKWFTTSFDLDIDTDMDVPIGLELGATAGTVARVLLFVNGYQYGKYIPHIGPQTRFPIPPGIINMRGRNSLSIVIWAQTVAGAKLSKLRLIEYARYESGFPFDKIDSEVLQPKWKNRNKYA